MIFFFDTETTGFVNKRASLQDDCQPHLVQIAGQLTSDEGEMLSQFSFVVNPGVPIPKSASDVHGITNEKAEACGISETSALGLFIRMAGRADLVVAHNIDFDRTVMEVMCARQIVTAPIYQEFCTMKAAKPVVNLPPTERMVAAGMNGPKAPKLEECIGHFFDEPLEGAHDALVDVIACKRVFFHLKGLEAQS